jgi:hypothetical protein
MFVAVRIAQRFENFKHVRLAQPFVVAPAHCGKLAVQNVVSPQFRAKSVVGHVHHRGDFLCGIVHPQYFLGGFVSGFHGTFKILINEKRDYINCIAIIFYCFGIIFYCFGNFSYYFKSGANKTVIFSRVKGIFSE